MCVCMCIAGCIGMMLYCSRDITYVALHATNTTSSGDRARSPILVAQTKPAGLETETSTHGGFILSAAKVSVPTQRRTAREYV